MLDAGAVAAYASGSDNLGELLIELADEAAELDADLGFEIPAVAVAVETADAENRSLDSDDAVYLVTTEPRRYQTPTLDGLNLIPIQR